MYKISWKVIHGNKDGRKLGFPTANIRYTDSKLEDGTYNVNIQIWEDIYCWVWVYLPFKEVFEVHIFGFSEDIYDRNIHVYIKSKLRNNQKFESFKMLQKQIQNDIKQARETNAIVLTFWSFDLVHPGHNYYLSEAKKYGDRLITIVASDENILKIKWFSPQNLIDTRVAEIQGLWVADEVKVGSNSHPLQWLQIYKPDSICLWYDQRWPFVDILEKEIEKLCLKTRIIRIDPFNPENYKSSLLKAKK